jgi:hypothetical protein
MGSSLAELQRLVDDFLDGGPFWPFWNAFMEHMEGFEPEWVLSPAGQRAYDELYELVCMGAPDPVPVDDRALGVIGETELRARLRAIRLEATAERKV